MIDQAEVEKILWDFKDGRWIRSKTYHPGKRTITVITEPYNDGYDEDEIIFSIQVLQEIFAAKGIEMLYEGDSAFNPCKRFYRLLKKE